MNLGSAVLDHQPHEGEENRLNSELWHACAGPLVSLPAVGSHVVYFPQGHSEQVAVSTNKEVDGQIPNYPSLPPQLICQLHNVTMHADVETDEVYAQMTLQPLTHQEQKEISFHPADLGLPSKQPTNYFCKTLTASDTSTHGGFSVPRRAAEKVFPPLDFSQQPPVQELIARDLHNNEWKFRHIFRGQPKRHLLTTGWSVFVNAKRLVAGDSVLFIWNEKNQLLLGIRRANRTQTVMPSSVLSSDSMHHGLLAAAAHASATNSRFTIFYNPRASPSEFVIPLAKYVKAVYHTRVSVGMRFRMLFETEESSVRRYMGTITGISDSDPARWPSSHWRSVKVGWDESTAGEKQPRVSLWEIEPLTTFPMYPSPFPMSRLKRPWPHAIPSYMGIKNEDMGLNSPLMWLHGVDQSFNQGFGVSPFLMQQQPTRLDASILMQNEIYQAMALQEMRAIDPSRQHILSPPLHQSHVVGNGLGQPPQMLQQSHPVIQNLPQTQQQLPDNMLLMHPNPYIAEPHQVSSIGNTVQPHLSPHFQPQSPLPPMRQNMLEPNTKPVSGNTNHPSSTSLHGLLGDDASNLVSMTNRSSNLLATTNGCWPTKRVAIDPLISTGGASHAQVLSNPLASSNMNSPTHNPNNHLPPFPGRTRLNEPEVSQDPQSNNFLFGISNDNTTNTFASSSYMSTSVVDDSLSNPIDDSGLLHQPLENANPHNGTFVKVYKSRSYGRSLDITKFSSYDELRSALAQMFGLEGQLEDPMRSGWQLVFVDRENDVLLLGDDPWQEFVNSVWCIKILSPQEVQDMRRQGMKLASSVSIQRFGFQNGGCDDGMSRQNGMMLPSSVAATLDF